MNKKRFKEILKILAVQILALILVFPVAGELMLRLLKDKVTISRPQQLRKDSLQHDQVLFARHTFPLKEQDFVYHYWKTKKYGYPNYHINPKGYRGPDFDAAKTPGAIRIMVYGGSAVFDLAMPEGKDWPHRVEQYLHMDGFTDAQVINAGIPGHASFDSLGRLFAEGHHLKPDYVILYNTWNDIKRFASDKTLLRDMKPYSPRNNAFLFYRNYLDQFFGTKSYLYAFLRQRYLQWKHEPGLEGAAQKKDRGHELNQDALDQFRLNIEMFVDCARNIGAVPVLMTQGSLIDKDSQNTEKWRLRHVDKMVPYDFSYVAIQRADQIIRDVTKAKGAYLIDAKKILVEKDKPLYFDHVHLGDEGSKELAMIVKDALEGLIFKKTGDSRPPGGGGSNQDDGR